MKLQRSKATEGEHLCEPRAAAHQKPPEPKGSVEKVKDRGQMCEGTCCKAWKKYFITHPPLVRASKVQKNPKNPRHSCFGKFQKFKLIQIPSNFGNFSIPIHPDSISNPIVTAETLKVLSCSMLGSLLGTVGFAGGLQCLTPTLFTQNLAKGLFTALPIKPGRGTVASCAGGFCDEQMECSDFGWKWIIHCT